MAQKTAWDGAALTESDINTFLMGEGGAWTSWTPTVTQSGAVTVTVTRARFARYGRTIHATCKLTVTGSGTGGNNVGISLPVTAATSGEYAIGTGGIFDTSAAQDFTGPPYLNTTTQVLIKSSSTTAATFLGANTFTAGLAVGDVVALNITYEAAS